MALLLETCVSVEHVEVCRRIQQHLVLVLAVEVDERPGQIAERAACDERAVHERAAPSLRRHFSPDDDFTAVGGVEDRFDRRGILSRAHELGGGASADEKPDRTHEDRLAGAGLAG